jgi:hypothetical protein
MRISFDLDDTLILKSVDGPCEESFPARRRGEAIEEDCGMEPASYSWPCTKRDGRF